MSDSQKFIARNRSPRVQIEYDVELYGAQKKVQLPFVMGVFSDLSGKAEKPNVDDRSFLEIDVDNFNDRMRAIAPKVQFSVPNTLTGDGNLSIDLTFTSMDDFSPEAIAEKVDSLRPLLEARRQLSDLMVYMDGKAGAEALIENLLTQPQLLTALSGSGGGKPDIDAALESLRDALPEESAPEDETDATLASLAMHAPKDAGPDTSLEDALGTLQAPPETEETDEHAAALDALRSAPLPEATVDESSDDVLASLAQSPPPQEMVQDETDSVLSGMARVDVAETNVEESSNVLASIRRVEDTQDIDRTSEVLGTLAPPPELAAPEDETSGILDSLERVQDAPEQDLTADILSGIAAAPVQDQAEEDSADDILAALDAPTDDTSDKADLDDILGGLSADSPDLVPLEPGADDILAGLQAPEAEPEDINVLDDILSEVAATVSEDEEADDTDDILAGLEAPEPATAQDDGLDDILTDISANPVEEGETDDLDDILSGLEPAPTETPQDDDLDDILAGLDSSEDETDADQDLDALLADMSNDAAESLEDDLDDILSGLDAPEEESSTGDDLDALMADLDAGESEPDDEALDLDDILAGLDTPEEESSTGDDLDALMADLDAGESEPDDGDLDLDDILAGLDDDASDSPADDLDDLLADLDGDTSGSAADDLDDLLAGLDETDGDTDTPEPKPPAPPVQSPFGKISATRPAREELNRKKFRMAMFGDFTGRASRGLMETGPALAARRPILLDVDTIDEIIEGFGTTLNLQIGKEGTRVEVKLKELDDLHPDELYDNISMFDELSGLRQQLAMGSMADKAIAQLQSWSQTYATPIKLPKRSASTSVPANLKLSDFQALIGDTAGKLTPANPADDLIAQIVGPHIVKAPDAGASEMTKAVDAALSTAMRLILHHPDFQAVESQWRSLDLLARRIETDSKLEIVLYDVSAEELAADLAAHEDLSESGLFQLVTDVLDPEEGAGGYSALFGLYTFEETPPHAELLARIGQVGAHVDAPFFAAITPGYLDVAKEDRHPLVAEAWDTLRGLPEAAYLALASPRFLLRLPYGAKSDPIYPFEFEEFTPHEGLKGMLWANPVVMVAILLAGTFKKDGKAMDLGTLMSLGDLPFHYVTDRFGDQVALPCTERNLTSSAAQTTLGRGYMPVVWVKGRNEIRLGSFRSLAGEIIAGPWEAEVPAPRPSPGSKTAAFAMDIPTDDDGDDDSDTSLDNLLGDLDDVGAEDDDDLDTSLDDLLSGFDDFSDDDSDSDDDEMDAELAALLEGL